MVIITFGHGIMEQYYLAKHLSSYILHPFVNIWSSTFYCNLMSLFYEDLSVGCSNVDLYSLYALKYFYVFLL